MNRVNLKREHQRARRKAARVRKWWEQSKVYGSPAYFERRMYEAIIDGHQAGRDVDDMTGRG